MTKDEGLMTNRELWIGDCGLWIEEESVSLPKWHTEVTDQFASFYTICAQNNLMHYYHGTYKTC